MQSREIAAFGAALFSYMGQWRSVLLKGLFLMRFEQRRISVSAFMSCALLAGCGGGSHRSTLPQAAPFSSTAPSYTGPLADATFKITIPVPEKTSTTRRRPAYVSSSTAKVVFTLNSDTVGLTGAALATFNTNDLGAQTVTLNSAQCPGTGPWTCTFTIKLPPGTDNVTMSAQDASSNVLSQQIQDFTVVAAVANSFNVILDANAATLTINGSQPCQSSAVSSVFGSVGTTPVTFSAAYTDAATKTIVAPGLPVLQIQANHAGDTAYHPDTGIIDDGSGNTVTFTINQAAQTFVLMPSSSSVNSASINIKATPRNTNTTSDGLAFIKPKTFAFSTGVAPPTTAFLAVVEQTGANSGQVDFFQMTLGGSGGPDTFGTYATAPTLAVTASNGGSGPPDVDNPLQLAWDTNGDLLIANGGTTVGGDVGNLACVPIGAIATGANTSTTTTSDVNDPTSMAYNSTNGNVAFADAGSSATYDFSEYTLSGNYTEVTAARINDAACNSTGVVSLPTLAAGTFAVSLVCPNGGLLETDPAHGGAHAKVTIVFANGTTSVISDDQAAQGYAVDNVQGIGWDSADNQLVIANESSFHKTVSFYTVSPVAQQKVINTTLRNYMVATTTDGHVAIAGLSSTGSGKSKILIYQNASGTTLPTLVGTIPFNQTTTACGATYVYGANAVRSMTWLSNTKLLVALQSNAAGKQGLYIFDISASASPGGFQEESGCGAEPNGPAQSGFKSFTNVPYGTAYKQ